jgi:UDP-2,3-diacylglucosamine pyrophosphatase LpxH
VKYHAVFISDLHLGTQNCKEKELLEFLKNVQTDNLYLVGDIIDGWAMSRKHYWTKTQTEILRRILKLSEKCNVYYIAGNHDQFIRPFFKYDFQFGRTQICDSVVHVGVDGRRIYITHGDHFDFWMRVPKKLINIFAHITDLPFMAEKRKVTNQRYLRQTSTEKTVIRYAKLKGYDGVLCGHTHYPKMTDFYMNDGDWTRHCSYITEDFEGQWELKYYGRYDCQVAKKDAKDVSKDVDKISKR